MVLLTAYIKTFSVYADNILSDFVVAVVIICMNIFIINGEYQRNIQEQKCEYLINLATVRFSPLTYNTDFQTGGCITSKFGFHLSTSSEKFFQVSYYIYAL